MLFMVDGKFQLMSIDSQIHQLDQVPLYSVALMGNSRIFDLGGPRIEKPQDDHENVTLFALNS